MISHTIDYVFQELEQLIIEGQIVKLSSDVNYWQTQMLEKKRVGGKTPRKCSYG